MKKALITGVTGQDGSYLAKFLLKKGYQVHGIKRRTSQFNTYRIEDIYEDVNSAENLFLHFGDLADSTGLVRLIQEIKPDEIYNLGAQSHVKVSFEIPEYTADVDALGVLRILEAVRLCGLEKKTKIYQASSSEMYGKVTQIPQDENTSFYPRSPYGVSKLFGFWITKNYRESYGMFAANGILFNHESRERGETFVTRKITRAVAGIQYGSQDEVVLGNLDAKRDWGHAEDYAEAMWRILQAKKPDDYVVATGEQHSVREFVELAFTHVGLTIKWKGKGLKEVGVDQHGKIRVRVSERYFRPAEVDTLLGDATKARKVLKWKPKHSFKQLVEEMMNSDLGHAKKAKLLKDNGYSVNR